MGTELDGLVVGLTDGWEVEGPAVGIEVTGDCVGLEDVGLSVGDTERSLVGEVEGAD